MNNDYNIDYCVYKGVDPKEKDYENIHYIRWIKCNDKNLRALFLSRERKTDIIEGVENCYYEIDKGSLDYNKELHDKLNECVNFYDSENIKKNFGDKYDEIFKKEFISIQGMVKKKNFFNEKFSCVNMTASLHLKDKNNKETKFNLSDFLNLDYVFFCPYKFPTLMLMKPGLCSCKFSSNGVSFFLYIFYLTFLFF